MASVTAGSGDAAAERAVFVRKATGLVRGWSTRDAFIYAAFSINLITLGLWHLRLRAVHPGGQPHLGGAHRRAATWSSRASPTRR